MKELKAAAYYRVSINHEEQESSLESQISYYEMLITKDESKGMNISMQQYEFHFK